MTPGMWWLRGMRNEYKMRPPATIVRMVRASTTFD